MIFVLFNLFISSNDIYCLDYISGENFNKDLSSLNFSIISIDENLTIDITGKFIKVYAKQNLKIKVISKSLGILILERGFGCTLDIYGPSIIKSTVDFVQIHANVNLSNNNVPYIETTGTNSYISFKGFPSFMGFIPKNFLASYVSGNTSDVFISDGILTTDFELPLYKKNYKIAGYNIQIIKSGFDRNFKAIYFIPWIGYGIILLGVTIIVLIFYLIQKIFTKKKESNNQILSTLIQD